MALRINTNVAALSAHQSMIQTDNKLSESLGRLSTGLRINKAADDASGMTIADSLRAQHLGIGQAVRNANDGISMVQTADGALQESINIINTIKTKAIQAASDSQTTDTRKAIQADIDKLMEELDVIARTTSYNGQKLLSGAFTNKKIQIGAFSNETASISIGSTESTKTGHISTANLSLATDAGGEVQLTITSSITGEEITLANIDIQSNNSAENGMGALAEEVNRYASTTGINATAIVSTTTSTAIQAGDTGSGFAINGVNIGAITVSDNDSSGSLVSAINGKTTEHGITAAINEDGSMTLTSSDGRAIEVTGSVSSVFGSTSSQMSTIGYLGLTQAGTSQFQISGVGAGAAGADILITNAMVTVEDSILASGSTIADDSILAAGTVIGGDITLGTAGGDAAAVASTQLDFELAAGSTLGGGTVFATGTVFGGMVTTSTGAGETTTIDTLLRAGSTLGTGSVTTLLAGTVVTTQFTEGTTTYNVGDVLTSNVALTSELTLQADMVLEEGSIIGGNSRLAEGSVAGADIDSATSGTTTLSSDMTLLAGSDIAISGGGTTLLAGTILGDSVAVEGATSTYQRSEIASGSTIEAGSTLGEGSTIGGAIDDVNGATALTSDMTIKAGSTLAIGTILAVGTVITQDFTDGTTEFNEGDVVTTAFTLTAALTLSEDMILLEDSTLGDTTSLTVNTANSGTVGLSDTENLRLADLSVLTQEDAQNAIDIADAALKDLDRTRAGLGSVQNQLVSTIANLSVTKTNIQASESAIRDVDFAEEASMFSKLQLLSQTGSFAMAQANAASQNILSLLQ